MASEGMVSVPTASLVEDVIQQHGSRLYDLMASRKAEQAATRRYEVAGWLRKIVGAVGARDLPESPSEDEFRLGLRSGYILCNAMNKVQPGAIPRVVEISADSVTSSEGTPLSSYQHFENIRNFLDVAGELGLPLFEASDLEKGGKSGRVVTTVLALKSYSEWKQSDGTGLWKYNGNMKPISSGKFVVRKNAELFGRSILRSSSLNGSIHDFVPVDQSWSESFTHQTEMILPQSLKSLVHEFLSNKKPEEIPTLVEYILSKVMVEFEQRLANQISKGKIPNDVANSKEASVDMLNSKEACADMVSSKEASVGPVALEQSMPDEIKAECMTENMAQSEELPPPQVLKEESTYKLKKQISIIEQQQKEIQELKHTLCSNKVGIQFMQRKCSEDFCSLGKHLRTLAHAASGYHRVLEENRKLYNQVQDLKGNIRVYCRVRPFLPGQTSHSSTIGDIDDSSISIMTPAKYVKEGQKSFTFNKVFGPSATQEEVFLDTQPLIRSVLDGYNVCIFAYGQTGSGKTYTMTGPKQITPEGQGVNYRALGDLFTLSEQRKNTISYEISVQMMEIYNEQVRDLLCSDGHKKVEIRNSSQKGLNVPDATLVPVSSTSDVMELMNLGHKNRAVSATAMNDRSSRSHSCLTVHVHGKESTSGNIIRGCMHLVDLAGSERVDKSEVVGERLKEAQHINKSLAALGDVIAALAQKGSHVPYRNSKLTQLLQDSLGGQAKTLMFVHISPEADAVGETISTLKFAERVSTIELGAARANKENPEVKELKEQIAALKEALSRKNEVEHPYGVLPSPNSNKKGALPPLVVPTNRERASNILGSQARQPMEEVGNIESWSSSSIKQKKQTLNSCVHEVLSTSNSASLPERNVKVDEKEVLHDEWINKVVDRDWPEEGLQLPDFFYQRYNAEVDIDKTRSGSVTATTDDSDDFDMATSDSSETEMLWQFNQEQLKAASVINGSVPKIKKVQGKSARSGTSDIRTPTHPVGSSSSRKVLGKSASSTTRSGRQSIEGVRRQPSSTKAMQK